MRTSPYRWLALFVNLSFWFAFLFALVGAVVRGIWPPFYGWLTTDVWLWEPFGSWLRFVVLGAVGGVLAGGLFTNYQWLLQTSSSLARKVITTALVVTIYVVLLVVLREWIGRVLPG